MSQIHIYLKTIIKFQCQEWISAILSMSNFFFSTFLVLIFFVKKEFVQSSNRFLCSSKSISIVIPVNLLRLFNNYRLYTKLYDRITF